MEPAVFLDDARGCQCSFVSAFIHRVVFQKVFGHRVLIKSDWEIWVFRHVAPPLKLHLEFFRETGLILRCDRNVGIPFQTKQGN